MTYAASMSAGLGLLFALAAMPGTASAKLHLIGEAAPTVSHTTIAQDTLLQAVAAKPRPRPKPKPRCKLVNGVLVCSF